MKLFRTESENVVVTDCQKRFTFLPVSYQIDIRTTKFLEKFTSSENLIGYIFLPNRPQIICKNILKIR